MNYENYLQIIEDFPLEGVSFKDVTPLVSDGMAFKSVIDEMKEFALTTGATKIIGPESRGFTFGAPLAYAMGLGFIMARKPGKLPGKTVCASYELEYGTAELHVDITTINPGDKILIVDDIIATGGTITALIELINKCQAEVVGITALIGLEEEFGFRKKFKQYKIKTLLEL